MDNLMQGAVDIYEAVRGRKSLRRGRLWLLLVGGIEQRAGGSSGPGVFA